MDTSLSKHGVVFDLAFAQGRAVVGNQNELGLALAQSFQRCFVSKGVLSTLHHKLKTGVDGIGSLLLLRRHLSLAIKMSLDLPW